MSDNIKDRIASHFIEAQQVLSDFLVKEESLTSVEKAGALMVQAIQAGNKILSCGNGGSHCDAMHFAEELTGRYREDRKAFPAMAISDVGHISCVGNDYGYESIFSRFLEGMGKSGDVLLAISTSGNSKNVIKAANTAKAMGIKVVGLTGNDGGSLAPLCDVEIRVPHKGYADRIQEVHIKVIHALIDYIELALP